MMHFQSEKHSDQVLGALQTENGCDILLIGNDNVSSHSDSLWILSTLVRSIIDSLKNVEENLLIIPDFSSEDIKTVLDIIHAGMDGKEVWFNSATKYLLETLGIDFDQRNVSSSALKIEREDTVQVMLLTPSPDEETEGDRDDTLDELTPTVKLEEVDLNLQEQFKKVFCYQNSLFIISVILTVFNH